ncbi:MAG: hypothetical protein QHJ73_13300, partial [Armatimonadota bacterium]|nr:hypothetical protein [Armatimonadota bacterium]
MRYVLLFAVLWFSWCLPSQGAPYLPSPTTLTFDGFANLSAFTLNGSAAEMHPGKRPVVVRGKPVLRLTSN